MALSPTDKRLIALIGKGGNDASLYLLRLVEELEGKVSKLEEALNESPDERASRNAAHVAAHIKEITKGDKGDDGDTPTDEQLRTLIWPMIPARAEDGKTPTKEELLALIRPLIPPVKDGETPSDARLLRLIEPLIPAATVIDEAVIARNVENEIESKLPQFGTSFRDGLEILVGEERLDISAIRGMEELEKAIKDVAAKGGGKIGWGAHPLTIQESGTTKAKVARVINFTGATVSLSKNGVITVAISGGSGSAWTKETPTGTVDGSNTTFTVTATPQYIVIDGITYFENSGYTIVGTTITTTVPPTGFIMSVHA